MVLAAFIIVRRRSPPKRFSSPIDPVFVLTDFSSAKAILTSRDILLYIVHRYCLYSSATITHKLVPYPRVNMNFSFWFRATITSVLTLGILVDAQGTNISPGITWDVQKIVWDPVLETCKHIEKEQTKLIMEVVDMAKNALELLQDWENGTLEQKTKSRLKRNYHFFFNIGGENFYNFQARREQVSCEYAQIPGHFKSILLIHHPSSSDALGVISKIESEGNIYIMCTDEKIIHTDPSGYQYKCELHYSDSMSTSFQIQQLHVLTICVSVWPHGESSWVQPGEIVCSTEKVYGYTARWPRNPQSPRYIVLCPSKRPLSIEEVKDKIFEGQSLNDSYGLSTALFHELLHATIDYSES